MTVTIKRLRDKLEEDSKNPVYIKTVYGIGYTWVVDWMVIIIAFFIFIISGFFFYKCWFLLPG